MVPLRVPDGLVAPAAPPSAAPSLTYRGGPLLSAAHVFTFFWGDGWQGQPQADVMQQNAPQGPTAWPTASISARRPCRHQPDVHCSSVWLVSEDLHDDPQFGGVDVIDLKAFLEKVLKRFLTM